MKLFFNNEPLSALTHLLGFLLSIAALIVMIVYATNHGSPAHVVGFTIFGSSLILLYFASSLYHFFPQQTKIKQVFQRLDHAMIFVLIAGTYTPICLTIPQRGWGWSLFGVIWGLAAIGIVIKSLALKLPTWLTPSIYLVMGWLLLIAASPLLHWLPTWAFVWLLIGGLCYSLGVIFYALDRLVRRSLWFGMHEVFHVFVLAGSFSHFWLMFKYVLHA